MKTICLYSTSIRGSISGQEFFSSTNFSSEPRSSELFSNLKNIVRCTIVHIEFNQKIYKNILNSLQYLPLNFFVNPIIALSIIIEIFIFVGMLAFCTKIDKTKGFGNVCIYSWNIFLSTTYAPGNNSRQNKAKFGLKITNYWIHITKQVAN